MGSLGNGCLVVLDSDVREKALGGRFATVFLLEEPFRGADIFMSQHGLDGAQGGAFDQRLLAGRVPQG